ncbi:MAG: DUF4430 domain-containing protein [Clostridiales bacterium]|nr:DUF4430 domain-containing protein [Clostridiales bacterium]
MKKIKKIVTLLLIFTMLLTFVACEKDMPSLWNEAIYTEDTLLGEGAKTLTVLVTAEDKTVTFTIKTDKETVGDALIEHSLIDGEQSEYGLYIKKVNGIKADFDTDKAYWGFFQNGEYMITGVDTTVFESGQSYELVYTKG